MIDVAVLRRRIVLDVYEAACAWREVASRNRGLAAVDAAGLRIVAVDAARDKT